jgi:hypothetical protein
MGHAAVSAECLGCDAVFTRCLRCVGVSAGCQAYIAVSAKYCSYVFVGCLGYETGYSERLGLCWAIDLCSCLC